MVIVSRISDYFRCIIIISNITGIFVLNDGTAVAPWHLQEPHAYMNSCHLCAIRVALDGKVRIHLLPSGITKKFNF